MSRSIDQIAEDAFKYQSRDSIDFIIKRFPLEKAGDGVWAVSEPLTDSNINDLLHLTGYLQLYPNSSLQAPLFQVCLYLFSPVKAEKRYQASKSVFLTSVTYIFNKWPSKQPQIVRHLLESLTATELSVKLLRICKGPTLLECVHDSLLKAVEEEKGGLLIRVLIEAIEGSLNENEYIELALIYETQIFERNHNFESASNSEKLIEWIKPKHFSLVISKLRANTKLLPRLVYLLRESIKSPFFKPSLPGVLDSLFTKLSDPSLPEYLPLYAVAFLVGLADLILGTIPPTDWQLHAGLSKSLKTITMHSRTKEVGSWLWMRVCKMLGLDVAVETLLKDDWLWTMSLPKDKEAALDLMGKPIIKTDTANASIDEEKDQDSDENDFISFDVLDKASEGETSYKHLYQCLLAFRSSDTNRIVTSLKSLPVALINNLPYLPSIAPDLITALLLLSHPIDDFSTLKAKALLSLLLCSPDSFKTCFLDRFFKGDCSLGERIALLNTLNSALWDIGARTNTRKFVESVLEKADQLVADPWNVGDSLPTEGKHRPMILLVSDDSVADDKLKHEKEAKIENQSRRWGYAKKNRDRLLEVEDTRLHSFRVFESKFEDKLIEHLKPLYLVIFTDLMEYAK